MGEGQDEPALFCGRGAVIFSQTPDRVKSITGIDRGDAIALTAPTLPGAAGEL